MNARKAATADREQPDVTIVISFRERWRFTERTVESIIEHTDGKYALWLLDPGMPEAVREALKPHVDAGKLELVAVAPDKQPNQSRGEIAPRLRSRLAVFIDNDVVVTPGWLDALITCADETGAGIVCPLYLWGDREISDRIHMAGGDLTLEPTDQGVRMTERHRHVDRTIASVADDLTRKPCGFGEYHCLLMRREIYSTPEIFEPGIETVHEHIHASMLAREMGFETWFEPTARINYLALVPWRFGEIQPFRARWDYTAAERSLTHFAGRWKILDDDDFRSPVRRFLANHAGHSDVLDPRPGLAARRAQPISRADLETSFAGLQWRAFNCGYDLGDIQLLCSAYRVATALAEGIYRPCGRPFINHLAGTASVLLFYGCPMPLVLGGLLHATYTHGSPALVGQLVPGFGRSNARAKAAITLARHYAQRSKILDAIDLDGTGMDQLPVAHAALLVIDAANEVDMHLSLEVAVSGRTDVFGGKRLSDCQRLLNHVGLPGLATALAGLGNETGDMLAVPFYSGQTISFRITNAAADEQRRQALSAPAGQGQIAEKIEDHA